MAANGTLHKLGIRELDLRGGQRVLVRVDFNVPLRAGQVADDSRIRATLPTLDYLVQAGARVILMSHLGRPKGVDPALSLSPVAARLAELAGKPIAFASECVGEVPERLAQALPPGGILLLENLRFHREEEANDPTFSAALARLGQVYVNDAFGTAHRAHASTVGVTAYLHPAAAGLLLARELAVLGSALERPERPFVAILGGAKISGKIDVITHLLPRVDRMLIGGAMMFTFAAAQGLATGKSLVEPDRVEMARDLLRQAGKKLVLPVDTLAAKSPDASGAPGHVVPVTAIPADEAGVDIGPATIAEFKTALAGARTVLWNGPMGIFEVPAFARGTREVAKLLADATSQGATTIVGGGDSVAAIEEAGLGEQVSHLSTGGGASLEFLEGKVLPGVAALTDAG
ncbi:MAG TPA: phosphoglycerate kinase [Candidatus Udaeobacter sp.]|nr:phosphoglycerate kinase [Candidatus Udaeobacter sp.]